MSLLVIGTGYVGLVSAVGFADFGNTVVGIEKDPQKLEVLKTGKPHFFEPGLSEKMQLNIDAKRLSFSNELSEHYQKSKLIFIAVGTPPDPNGRANLSALNAVIDSICNHQNQLNETNNSELHKVIVIKSTVPVGTCKNIQKKFDSEIKKGSLSVVSNPEFLRQGSAVQDFFHPDRVVIGGSNKEALSIVEKLYAPLYRINIPIVTTDLQTSELSKYASNAFLAAKISFTNEIANLSEKVDANSQEVAKIMGMDNRIGKYFLHAGPGYGGSCFPKDTKALIEIAKDHDYNFKIVKATEEVNDKQKQRPVQILKDFFNNLEYKTITILGLSFKPNTDDIREAPSLEVISELLKENVKLSVFDPQAMPAVKNTFSSSKLTFFENSYDAAQNSDAVIIMTEWNTFRDLDLKKLKSLMRTPILIDMRNIYTKEVLKKEGFESYIIGKHSDAKKRKTIVAAEIEVQA